MSHEQLCIYVTNTPVALHQTNCALPYKRVTKSLCIGVTNSLCIGVMNDNVHESRTTMYIRHQQTWCMTTAKLCTTMCTSHELLCIEVTNDFVHESRTTRHTWWMTSARLCTKRRCVCARALPALSVCVTWRIYPCDMAHSYVWQGTFICATWDIYMCDMTHSDVWQDSFICVTWLVRICDMTH